MEINKLTQQALKRFNVLRIVVILLCIMCNVIMLVVPVYIGHIIDQINVLSNQNNNSFILIIFLFLLSAVFNFFQNFLWFKLTYLGQATLRGKVFERTLDNPVYFFTSEKKGDYVNKIINDVGAYASNRLISDAMLITNVSTLVIGFVYIFIINIYISIFIVVICMFYFASYLVINKKMRECSKEEKETNSQLIHTTGQMYSFSKTAKYYNRESFFSHKYNELVQELCNKSINLQKWKSLAGATSTALVQMILIFAVMFGIYFISIGKCTVGALFSIYPALPRNYTKALV
ncbi:ABC transporter transmembrane region [Butyrivibrio sp. INlla18]|uniref:ABC transporter transmembrane domain-containing protein n=1 Tax=Butyrivibrio sp. INlla18 TaxID=1520806 RepID=UPI00088BB1A3|nr:ABC transporter ATP-binding protein [Butyrivibrio sp. INlla18]SDA54749.1 ABC transporter transmembrane region [Butyrivibrio sp. INlla18]